MAEIQRSVFQANLKQLNEALENEDKEKSEELAKAAVFGLANLIFYELDRIADALEKLVDKKPSS